MFSKYKNYSFLILMSLVILGFSLINLFSPTRSFSELENRFLQTMPAFNLRSFLNGSYTTSFDSAINDQFFLRDRWINLKSRSEFSLGKRENNGIIYGSNHYLFKRFDQIDHATISKNAYAVATFALNHPDMPIYFMLIPNSYALMPELLPTHLIKTDQIKCINYIYKALDHTCKLYTVNIIPALLRHHDDYIYYRTDHHWTNIGAYLASYNFVLATEQMPLSPNPLQINSNEVHNFYGTYYNRSKFINVQPDTLRYLTPDVSIFIDGEPYPSLYDESKWASCDKYAAFLWGNNSLTTVINNTMPQEGRHLLLIKDSFGNSAVPFLIYNYRQIDVIDLRSITFNLSDYLKDNSFDEILIMYNFTNFNEDRNISKLNY